MRGQPYLEALAQFGVAGRLEFELAVTPAGSPLGLAAGVLAAVARNPRRHDVDFRLLLLGARRGRLTGPWPAAATSR